eukprot:3126319-Rhodomonas_salina.1
MGTKGSEVTALGEREPVTMAIGHTCKHKSRYTVLNLGDYDVILRHPFQKFVNAKIEGDDCLVPSNQGWQTLPRWAA